MTINVPFDPKENIPKCMLRVSLLTLSSSGVNTVTYQDKEMSSILADYVIELFRFQKSFFVINHQLVNLYSSFSGFYILLRHEYTQGAYFKVNGGER